MASKKSNKKKANKSGNNGEDTHAVHVLESQHREVEALFAAYEQASDPEEQESLFEVIADNLAAHARIEETIFYPECLTEATEDELREAVEEHLVIKRTLADLLDLSPGDEGWDGKMTVLKEQVEHHVQDEETKLFELVEEFAEEDLIEMGARMLEKFNEIIDQEPRHEVPDETDRAAPLQ